MGPATDPETDGIPLPIGVEGARTATSTTALVEEEAVL